MREHILLYNFRPDDRLAVLCKRDRVQQRIVTADELITPRFQSWLKEQNGGGANIHVSMNTLKPEATGRKKQDISAIRHIYLDIDHDGQDALARLMSDAPPPSCVLTTSPGKYQVIWKAEGFSHAEAEALQRAMAVKYGADRAAIDISRLLRLPGFTNRKYDPPCMVTAEKISDRICRPSDFRIERMYELTSARNLVRPGNAGKNTRSHSDWNEVCKRIENGEHPAAIQAWLESERRDKPNPKYYAERTVSRALSHCAMQTINKQQQENIMEKQQKEKPIPLTGDTFPVKDELKKIGCYYDQKTKQWYAPTPEIAKSAKEIIPPIYIIGSAPKGLADTLKELGCKWNERDGWNHTDPEKAKQAHQKILEASSPRYYLENKDGVNTQNIKEQLKEKDCRWDSYMKQWYAPTQEAAKQAQAVIDNAPKKIIIGSAPKGLADTLKELGCTWNEKDGWSHTDPEKAKQAHQKILDASSPRYYLENKDGANTQNIKEQLKERDCRWDSYKKQWYAPTQEAAKQAQAVIDNAPKKIIIGSAPKGLADALKELGCTWNEKDGWNHTDPEKAKQAHQKILEASSPRYYLENKNKADTTELKEELKEKDCRWDSYRKQWYAQTPEAAKQAQQIIDENAARYYVTNVPRELNEKMMELGGRWDPKEKSWYFTDNESAKAAKAAVDASTPREKTRDTGIGRAVEKLEKEVAREI